MTVTNVIVMFVTFVYGYYLTRYVKVLIRQTEPRVNEQLRARVLKKKREE
jgi:hypothetical protein